MFSRHTVSKNLSKVILTTGLLLFQNANAKPNPNAGPGVSAEAPALRPAAITEIRISGTINPGSADYIRTSLQHSEKIHAQAMILTLNTPGGLLSSTRDIVQMFSQSSLPVILFVSPGGASATSAGAVLSLAAHISAMAPGTNIGAAHPVGAGGEDVKSTMGQKITNDTAALVRAQAGLRHHNIETAEKIVTESLSFSSEEALKNNLTHFLASDLDSLLKQLDQKKIFIESKNAEVTLQTAGLASKDLLFVPMSWSQSFLHFVADPNISTSLLALAGIALYVEVASGFSALAPGVIGLLLAILGGVSLSMLPINLAGMLLFILGLIFFIAEIFVTSLGLLFVAGLISMCLGALFLIDPSEGSMKVSLTVLVPMILGFVLVGGTIAWMLKKERPMTDHSIDGLIGRIGHVKTLGEDARTGQLVVVGEIWNFICDDALEIGVQVEVIARNNLQLEVRRRNNL